MVLWYASGVDTIPKGNLGDQYLPNGLLNVHSFELASSNFSCQNPDDASNLLKYFAFANCDMIFSLVGSFKFSLLIALFKFLGSIQTLGFPFFLFTITSELTQSVARRPFKSLSNFPSCPSCQLSSFFCRANGTLQHRLMTGGTFFIHFDCVFSRQAFKTLE